MKLLTPLLLLLTATASAQWTPTILHPDDTSSSAGSAAAGGKQVGSLTFGLNKRAAIWSGTEASLINLHPTGATQSVAFGAFGNRQYGIIQTDTSQNAGFWTGTAASFVNIHPASALSSECISGYDTKQVGDVYKDGNYHAAMWSGTAATFVDLHPAGSSESFAYCGSGTKQYGQAKYSGTIKAGMWSGTAASWVLLHPAGASRSRIYGCTATQQVGHAILNEQYHAILWNGSASNYVDLHPAGSDDSEAKAAFGNLQVGNYYNNGQDHACVWSGSAASLVDLHASLPNYYLSSYAEGVSSDGVTEYIVGTAYNGTIGRDEAVVWTRPAAGFSFTLNKATVAGQNSVQGTITLAQTKTAPTVFSTYDNSSLVNTPVTVTVAANTLAKNFQITVTAVTAPVNTTIYAKLGTVTLSQALTLAPLIPTALSFTVNPVSGGQTTVCKVVINGVAGPGGRTIAILDNSPNATCPSTVVVPAGATFVNFNITTTPVTTQKVVTVTARVSAGEKTATFRIDPGK